MKQAHLNLLCDVAGWSFVDDKIYSSSERPCTHDTPCSKGANEEGVFVCVCPTDIMIDLVRESEAVKYEKGVKLQTLSELEVAGEKLVALWADVKTDWDVNAKSDFETWTGGKSRIKAASFEMPCIHEYCKSQGRLKGISRGPLHGTHCYRPTARMLSIVDAVEEISNIRGKVRKLDESILERGRKIAALMGNATRLCSGHRPYELVPFKPSCFKPVAGAGAGAGAGAVAPSPSVKKRRRSSE